MRVNSLACGCDGGADGGDMGAVAPGPATGGAASPGGFTGD